MNNRVRSLSLAVDEVGFLALVASTLFLSQAHWPKEQTGPVEKLTVSISRDLKPVLVKIAEAKGFFRDERLNVTLQLHAVAKLAGKVDPATGADTLIMLGDNEGCQVSILADIRPPPDKNAATVTRKDRGIVSVANLKGQKVSVAPGRTGACSLDSFPVINGMARQDV